MRYTVPFGLLLILIAVVLMLPSAAQRAQAANEAAPSSGPATHDTAIFAGGCFWCVEADFEKLDGVVEAVSGYTGGSVENPSYKAVSSEKTGHLEAVKVTFDPSAVSYRDLVDFFLRHIDPLDDGGQFCDRGRSYTSAIFVADNQRDDALAAVADAEAALEKAIVTPVRDAGTFWVAEDYHQNYYKKNPLRYRVYRTRCGRDRRIQRVWDAAG